MRPCVFLQGSAFRTPDERLALNIEFTDMAYGGDAVGKDTTSGFTVFAWPAIKGETADVEVILQRPNHVRALVTKLHTLSPLRAEPPCPYFGPCGGCQWQHITYPGQIQFKHETLRSQLERFGGVMGLDTILQAPIAAPAPFGYRNSSHFAIHAETKSLAYYKGDSHSLLPVATCPISNSGINRTIPIVNSLLGQALSEEILRGDYKGIMRAWKVSIRSSMVTGQTVVVFYSEAGGQASKQKSHGRRMTVRSARRITNHRPDVSAGPNDDIVPESSPALMLSRREIKRAVNALSKEHNQDAEPLALTVVEIMGDGTVNLLGVTEAAGSLASEALAEVVSGSLLRPETSRSADAIKRATPPLGAWLERLGEHGYWVAPGAFFQVNTAAAEEMLAEVLRHMPKRVSFAVDAHCGVGTFALALAGRATKVEGFETDTSAVASAQWSAQTSDIKNVEFRVGRAEQLLGRLPSTLHPDLVLVDPPRSGCHPDLLREITQRAVERVIYVSCDPSTLARDVKALAGNYDLKSARVIDMFPQTYHIETVAVLDRRADT